LVEGESDKVQFRGLDNALEDPDTALRLFGKPEVRGQRRMGVGLARGGSIDEAREKARAVIAAIEVEL
jgi:phosphoribosylglycinamide formyltransferase 2